LIEHEQRHKLLSGPEAHLTRDDRAALRDLAEYPARDESAVDYEVRKREFFERVVASL
jgi:hypothetical protein